MQLHDLLVAVDGPEVRGDDRVDVRSVVHDTRQVTPGALFCCVRGSTTDGHRLAAAAAAAGAVALLVEEPVATDLTEVQVPSVRAAMGPIAAAFHRHPSRAVRLLGVTGTNGKTTTTYLLEQIARAAGDVTGVIGTVETRIGAVAETPVHTTPEAPDLQALLARMRDAGVGTVAMEVSSHALDQHRVAGCWFAATCFTNLSHDHLDYHGTVDAYLAAKERLFTPDYTTVAAINADDPRGELVASHARARGIAVTTFGVAATADVRARDVELDARGVRMRVRDVAGRELMVASSLVGDFNAANVLAAVATARIAGVADDAIVAGLAHPVVVPGRMERVDVGQPFVVLVDYAHTPDALERVLGSARHLAGEAGRLLVVFGCGGDRDRAKRPRMGAIASSYADVAVVTSDNPRSEPPSAIVDEIMVGVDTTAADVVVELDRRLAIRAALGRARGGDVVVIAGKGHESGQTFADHTAPFDDRHVAREELEALRCA
ncbi:MAG TPA: UDP-N-acetylmuramoyl-L-alanyl-D-glutamate--2,6-diaminopimelate ligase [Acidimicrobiia bacterium]|nr:UDP-N-acetylmuramoyl-L-alanyl-D-glutamate--2,6-diaminopimelate ligase [Acidimicrobiia bacterium]